MDGIAVGSRIKIFHRRTDGKIFLNIQIIFDLIRKVQISIPPLIRQAALFRVGRYDREIQRGDHLHIPVFAKRCATHSLRCPAQTHPIAALARQKCARRKGYRTGILRPFKTARQSLLSALESKITLEAGSIHWLVEGQSQVKIKRQRYFGRRVDLKQTRFRGRERPRSGRAVPLRKRCSGYANQIRIK